MDTFKGHVLLPGNTRDEAIPTEDFLLEQSSDLFITVSTTSELQTKKQKLQFMKMTSHMLVGS